MYRIKVDNRIALVEVELGGLMSVEEVARYIDDLRSALIRHRLRNYLFLLDITTCPIQQQDMLRAMGQHMGTMPKARRIAVVTGSSLAGMQVRRLFTQPYARITANVADARAWLIDGTEPPHGSHGQAAVIG